MIKRIKFSKYIFKNKTSFIDFKIKFYYNLFYKHHVSTTKIENIKKYEYTFENKTLNQKQEIKLNNFLIRLLNCFKIDLNKECPKIDAELMNEKFFKYNEKGNILEKINDNHNFFSVPLKKISKKNCNSDENKFSIKILNTKFGEVIVGLTDLNVNFKNNYWIGKDSKSWGFDCANGMKWFVMEFEHFFKGFKAKKGDVIGLKFNSIYGEIEIFINGKSKGIMFDTIDISKNYRFAISLCGFGDKVKII